MIMFEDFMARPGLGQKIATVLPPILISILLPKHQAVKGCPIIELHMAYSNSTNFPSPGPAWAY